MNLSCMMMNEFVKCRFIVLDLNSEKKMENGMRTGTEEGTWVGIFYFLKKCFSLG
jgi:hypothetical protein